jgi:hypothetical protein
VGSRCRGGQAGRQVAELTDVGGACASAIRERYRDGVACQLEVTDAYLVLVGDVVARRAGVAGSEGWGRGGR